MSAPKTSPKPTAGAERMAFAYAMELLNDFHRVKSIIGLVSERLAEEVKETGADDGEMCAWAANELSANVNRLLETMETKGHGLRDALNAVGAKIGWQA